MRRGEFISLEAYVIAGCFAIITPGTLRKRNQRSQRQRKLPSPLKSSANTFRKILMANGLAAPIQRLGKWTLAATPSTSVRSTLVARILLPS